MKKAYSYLRMSTEIQLKGHSKARQLELSEEYAKKNGLQLESHYEDIGISAFKGRNRASGDLGRFLAAVEAGKVEKGSYLLVESLDRLSRDTIMPALKLLLSLIEKGIVVVTLADGMVYSEEAVNQGDGWTKLIISLTVMSRAHEESLSKSRRLSAAWANKRAKAMERKLTKTAPSWLKLSADRQSFELIPDRIEIVRKMFEDSKNGIGTISITRRLNQQGVPTWRKRINGRGWQQSTVKKILESRTVLGEYTPSVRVNGRPTPLEPIPSYYPAILSEELFYQAKASRESRRHRGGRKGKLFTSLFSTLVRCGYCGMAVRVHSKGPKPKGGVYMRCNAAIRGLGCKGAAWPYEQFETNFLSLIYEIDISKVVADEGKVRREADLTAQRDSAKAKAESAQKSQKNLLKLIESDSAQFSTPEALLARIAELEAVYKDNFKLVADLDSKIRMESAIVLDGQERQKQLRLLIEQMKGASEPDAYSLRAKLAQHIRELTDRILVFPNGEVSTSASRPEIETQLKAAGYDATSLKEYFALQDAAESEQKRCYVVLFRSGQLRGITPSADDPTLFKYIGTTSSADAGWVRDAIQRSAAASNQKATK